MEILIDHETVRLLLALMKNKHKKISGHNFTKKTKGSHYPISVGYSTQVRRPVRDLLQWMSNVEDLLELILEELD